MSIWVVCAFKKLWVLLKCCLIQISLRMSKDGWLQCMVAHHNRHCIGLDVESSSKVFSSISALSSRGRALFNMIDMSFSPLPTLKRP